MFVGLFGNFPNDEFSVPKKFLISLHDQKCHFLCINERNCSN